MRMRTAKIDWIGWMTSVRRMSARTVEEYTRDVSRFLTAGKDFTKRDVTRYLGALAADGISPASQARAIASLRSFFAFLIEDERMDTNPMLGIRAPKLPTRLPKPVQPMVLTRLIDSVDGLDARSLRDRAMLELAYGCGLRVTELVGLNLADYKGDHVVVIGKGNKQRLVPVNETAMEAIDRWLTDGRPTWARLTTTTLFVTNRGSGMTRNNFGKRLKKLALDAGVPAMSPHQLRHSMATHMYEGGADLRALQAMLGHSSIKTTTAYTQVSAQRMADVQTACHPRG